MTNTNANLSPNTTETVTYMVQTDNSGLNIYRKMQTAKVMLDEANIKKSGTNGHLKFKYYELADFMPAINRILAELGLYEKITFFDGSATLEIIDIDNPEYCLKWTFPMPRSELKDGRSIQDFGGATTYMKRYLYMTAFNITENDMLDANVGKEPRGNTPAQGNKNDGIEKYKCEKCGKAFKDEVFKNVKYTAAELYNISIQKTGHAICCDCHRKAKTEANSTVETADSITTEQCKRMFSIAGKGNENIVRSVLSDYGYESSRLVKKSDYESICEDIESEVMTQSERHGGGDMIVRKADGSVINAITGEPVSDKMREVITQSFDELFDKDESTEEDIQPTSEPA